ncbi:MAG: S24 family peptidase [Gallionella sp.]
MEMWLSIAQLLLLNIPGLPRTARGMGGFVKRERWESRTVPGQGGKGGVRLEFIPPVNIMDLIKAKQYVSNHKRNQPVRKLHLVDNNVERSAADDDSHMVAIDHYVEVSGSAGQGAAATDEAVVKVRVDTRLLRERIPNGFQSIKIASVSGDSMEPTLSHGDQVMVDTSYDRFVENAIYAIQQDGFLRFKRIQLKLDGSITVKSDGYANVEHYSAEEAALFIVVGIVIPFKFGRFEV